MPMTTATSCSRAGKEKSGPDRTSWSVTISAAAGKLAATAKTNAGNSLEGEINTEQIALGHIEAELVVEHGVIGGRDPRADNLILVA